MGFEVELKFRAVDHASLTRRLAELGATAESAIDQEDVYLAHPSRDFAKSGEAFRVRRAGAHNRVTYKGPKHEGPTKTREEIEIPFSEGSESFTALIQLFERLGFAPVATLRKRREPFHLEFAGHSLEIALDDAEGLGDFAEVEALAHSAADLSAAQSAILACAHALGLTEVEPRSYLRMALERRTAAEGQAARALERDHR